MLRTLLLAVGLTAGFALMHAEDAAPSKEKAIFAGGCFWCMQPPFDKLKGVEKTVVGYAGGSEKNPTYEQVSAGGTGHREAIEVTYDPAVVSYAELLKTFWHNINPTQTDGQFADRGHQYTTAIFYTNEAQKKAAEQSKDELAKSGKFDEPIATEIVAATQFWPAEEYHQKYYKKNFMHYKAYYHGSGRAAYVKRVWGK